jgi:hypothetical protein
MVFMETAYYTKVIADYLSDEDQGKFQAHLIEQPDDCAIRFFWTVNPVLTGQQIRN